MEIYKSTYTSKQFDTAMGNIVSIGENGNWYLGGEDTGVPASPKFIPTVDADGNISWSNDAGLDNPESANIKGPKGDKGDKGDTYNLTDTDKTNIAEKVVQETLPTETWIFTLLDGTTVEKVVPLV